MYRQILAAIPVKPFGVAKRRLSGRLTPVQRTRLGREVAARTAAAAADTGVSVAVVTGDDGVATWARSLGFETIDESYSRKPGLDGAASAVVIEAERRQMPWAIIHADLPLATSDSLRSIFDLAETSTVLVPSYNGGSNLVAGRDPRFRFRYGPLSFHRHLAANPRAIVRIQPQLALDLDTEADLDRALQSPAGRWLESFV